MCKDNVVFSICTEVTNREHTIIRTIESVRRQNFTNFEYLIVDNSSNDSSVKIINNYLKKFPEFSEKVTFKVNKKRVPDIESWNNPVRLAKGKYIVVLEGDDWFSPTHLSELFKIIQKHPSIGLVVSPNAKLPDTAYQQFQGVLCSEVMFESLKQFKFLPPPSETVFIREYNGKRFIYDQENFVYAGEYSILNQIFLSGLKTIVLRSKTVHRGVKLQPTIKNYFHIQDSYFCFEKIWKNTYTENNKRKARQTLLVHLTKILAQEIVWLKLDPKVLSSIVSESFECRYFPLLTFIESVYRQFVLRIKLFVKKGLSVVKYQIKT